MWPAFIINLKANSRRMNDSAEMLDSQGIRFERLEAVNGWQLSQAEIDAVYDARANARHARSPLIPPEMGCYLSHIKAWGRIAQGTQPGGFVFEDDFEAACSLGRVLGLLSQQASDWDIVKLFTLNPCSKVISRTALGDEHEIVSPYWVPTILLGYGITREAAVRLIEHVPPFFRAVDEDLKFFWETGMRVALVLPPPLRVGNQEAATGTIGNERCKRRTLQGRGAFALVRKALRGFIYQARYQFLLHWHRFREPGA